VAVLGVAPSPFMEQFGNLTRADGVFILVTVGVSNHQHDSITMDNGLFEIVDSKGDVYAASSKSMSMQNDLFLAGINPGITKRGTIVFDVPQSILHDELRLRFRGGMTGKTAELPLSVQIQEPVREETQEPVAEPAPQPPVSEAVDSSQPVSTPAPIVREPPPSAIPTPQPAIPNSASPNQ
jgi:hypothetical protein